MLRHLTLASQQIQLHYFNHVWQEETLLLSWKLARVVLLLRPGKNSSVAVSYHPPALTSCLGKTLGETFETRAYGGPGARLVSSWKRLTFLTNTRVISGLATVLRAAYSTLDHKPERLLFVDSFTCRCFATQREHTVLHDVLEFKINAHVVSWGACADALRISFVIENLAECQTY